MTTSNQASQGYNSWWSGRLGQPSSTSSHEAHVPAVSGQSDADAGTWSEEQGSFVSFVDPSTALDGDHLPLRIEDFFDADFEPAANALQSDGFLASWEPVAPSDDGFMLVEAGRSEVDGAVSEPTGDADLPSREMGSTLEEGEGDDLFQDRFDVVECVGSSQTTAAIGTDAGVAEAMPVLMRTSTGVPGTLDVLICTLCGRGQAEGTWTAMGKHWRSRAHGGTLITAKERQDARALFEGSQGQVLKDATAWDPPRTPIAPIEHLEIVDAYRCGVVDCANRFVPAGEVRGRRGANSAWREHQRLKHGASEFGTRGRPPVASAVVARAQNCGSDEGDTPEGAWGSLRRVQRLFLGRPYHEVSTPGNAGPTAEPWTRPMSQEAAAVAATTFGHLYTRLQHEQAKGDRVQATVIPAPGDFEVNAWFRSTGFAKRLHGYEWNAARKVADAPSEPASDVQRWVHVVAAATIRKSYRATTSAGPWLRQEVNRRRKGEAAGKELDGYKHDSAVQGHMRPLLGCINFFSATHLDPDAQAAVPPYARDVAVERAWDGVIEHAEGVLQSEVDDDMASGADDVDKGDDTALFQSELLMLELIMALLRQRGAIDEAQELPLIVALTVQGIVPGKNTGFRRAGEYSRTLASFGKMARCVVCKYVLHKGIQDPTDLVDTVLVRGPNTAMNWVGRMLNTAMEMDKTTPNHTKLTWLPAEEKLLFKEHAVSRTDLVGIVHGALEQARRVLCSELLFVSSTDELPPVPWDRMVDRPGDGTVGLSCWTDAANHEALSVGRDWLMHHVTATQAAHFVDEESRGLRESAVVHFEASLQRFRDTSLPLFTWAIGPPIRGQTVGSYQWRNTPENPRNLVVHNGSLLLVGGWHKTLARSGAEAALHVLPREIADLWAWYLWLVWPFWDTLRRDRRDEDTLSGKGSELLFPGPHGQALSSTHISDCLLEASRRVVRPGFGLQAGRQLVSGFTRHFIPPEVLAGGGSYFMDSYQRAGGGASGRRGATSLAASAFPSGCGEDDAYAQDVYDLEEEENCGELPIHNAGGHPKPRAPLEASSFASLKRIFSSRSILAQQTGHSTAMDRLRYACDVNAIPGSDDLALALWSYVSHHWHMVLRLPSALEREQKRREAQEATSRRSARVKRDREVLTSSRDSGSSRVGDSDGDGDSDYTSTRTKRARQGTVMKEPSAGDMAQSLPTRAACRRLLQEFVADETADFRDQQWDALECIVGYSGSSVVVVAPTGNGKTALIALPAMLPEAGVTVVVVPLCSLRDNLAARCHRASIRCERWRGDADPSFGLYNQANVVLVMPEHLKMESFPAWIRVLKAQGRLDRIVVDEAHMPLITNLDWRPVLRDYATLAMYGAPLVLLTATLPIAEERELLDLMRLQHTPPRIFRSPTVRRNVAYSVVWVEDQFSLRPQDCCSWAQIATLVLRHRRRMMAVRRQAESKTIVFIDNTDAVKNLAGRLPNASPYFHDAPDGATTLAAFAAASNGILCTTSAGGHGLDIGDLDDAVHASIPRHVSAYIQETGRVGRDGRASTAVLLVGPGIQRFSPKNAQETAAHRYMDKYIQLRPTLGARLFCRRKIIDAYLDGNDARESCRAEEGELQCDVCVAREAEAQHLDDDAAAVALAGRPVTPPPAYEVERDPVMELDTGEDLSGPAPACMRPRNSVVRTPQHRVAPSPRASASGSRSDFRADSSDFSVDRSEFDASENDAGAAFSSPAVAPRHGSVHLLGSPRVPAVLGAPLPNQGTRDRATALMQWRAEFAQMADAQWSDPKARIHLMAMYWKTHCPAHMLQGGDQRLWIHTRGDCSGSADDTVRMIRGRVRQLNSTYRMPPYTGCTGCKMPQVLCSLPPCSKRWEHLVMDAWVFCTELSPTTKALHKQYLDGLQLEQADSAAIMDHFKCKVKVGGYGNRVETSRLVEWLVQLTEQGFTRKGKQLLGRL